MAWNWKFLVIELTVLGLMSLSLLWVEQHELNRLTMEGAKKLRREQVTTWTEGARQFRAIARVMKLLSPLTLAALALVTIIDPADWIRNLGIGLGVAYGYFAVHRLARIRQTVLGRAERLMSEMHGK